jgi:hypothetical protein
VVFLARGVTAAKWKKRKVGRQMRVPADGLTNDFRVQDDCLSFWTCDPTQATSLEEVVLALASARDNIDRLDLVWVDQASITTARAKVVETLGETPAYTVRDRHRDVADLGLNGVAKLANGVAKAINGTQTKRWSKAEVQKILVDAAQKKALDVNQLKDGIRSKLEATQKPE